MTVAEWLKGISSDNTSTEEDSQKMQNLLRGMGFSKARAVMGVVYVDGRGQPASIQSMARMLLDASRKATAKKS